MFLLERIWQMRVNMEWYGICSEWGDLFAARVQILVVHSEIRTQEIRFASSRRLDGHLCGVLEYEDWELYRGHAREPQAEVSVHLVNSVDSVHQDNLRLGLIHYFHIINKTYIRFWLITFSGSICSTRRSSIGMKEGDKWQFWKKTHFPRSIELFIIASAIGPCYSGKFNSFNLEAIYADDINVRNMLSLNTSVIAPVPDRERSRSASFQSAFRQRTCRDQQQGRCPARARTRSALWAKSPWISLPTLSSAIKYILKFYLFVYVEFTVQVIIPKQYKSFKK